MSLLAKPGLLLIKTAIQKRLGYKIAWYDMVLNVLGNKIEFRVPDLHDGIARKYPYDDNQGIMKIVKTMTQKKLDTDDVIDIIKIEYREDLIQIGVYYTDIQQRKQSKTITL